MKSTKNKIISVFAALFIWGCGAGAPAEPHIFVSSYEPLGDEFFSEYENSAKAIYSVTGSGFLRQRGGGIINCAGNEVKAVPVMPSSNYVNEVNSLMALMDERWQNEIPCYEPTAIRDYMMGKNPEAYAPLWTHEAHNPTGVFDIYTEREFNDMPLTDAREVFIGSIKPRG